MSKGGIREGAGRKPRTHVKASNRTVRFTDDEWDIVKFKAVSANKTVSDYIRAMVLVEEEKNS
ncbi:plasmid mobilization protein [Desulfosporosinus shakirovi]|uniref:plasmid mobilization protein n=1 Tax=Desulfosporosinus shakirovi TaxID=2885154 RepID=UPI001E3E6FE1|nr:hypothetical protein [Desulfosporosinus sp. SRJS8]MCB8815735.1 hypothetical protein [Desulfosporosinus sp. SRJS8]